jgi:hypothetical protein
LNHARRLKKASGPVNVRQDLLLKAKPLKYKKSMVFMQWLSIASAGLLVYALVCSVLVVLTPLSRQWVRLLTSTGMLSLAILTLNCGIIYFWQQFWR